MVHGRRPVLLGPSTRARTSPGVIAGGPVSGTAFYSSPATLSQYRNKIITVAVITAAYTAFLYRSGGFSFPMY
jgi:hypothetical protein